MSRFDGARGEHILTADTSSDGLGELRDALVPRSAELAQAFVEARVGHAAEEERRAVRLRLRLGDLGPFGRGERAPRRLVQAVQVELYLPRQPAVEQLADAHVVVDARLDLARFERARDLVDDQRVELGVLALLEPMVLEET